MKRSFRFFPHVPALEFVAIVCLVFELTEVWLSPDFHFIERQSPSPLIRLIIEFLGSVLTTSIALVLVRMAPSERTLTNYLSVLSIPLALFLFGGFQVSVRGFGVNVVSFTIGVVARMTPTAILLLLAIRVTRRTSQRKHLVDVLPTREGSEDDLGRGSDAIARVIRSTLERTSIALRTTQFSMWMMMVLLFLGGGASIGLWATDYLGITAALRTEYATAARAASVLKEMQAFPDTLRPALATIQTELEKSKEQVSGTHAVLQQRSGTNLSDVAIRATIGLLTLFLVQVFFAVYKYSRRVADILADKAEALEILRESQEELPLLRRELVAVVRETGPAFGSDPKTLVDQAVRIAERIVGKKAE